MNVSIIIPAINEATVIHSAVSRAWQAGAFEVIVVDGGSCDATVDLARQAGAEVLQSRAGRARQQNAGACSAGGDVLLFLHADTWLEPRATEQIQRALHKSRNLGGAFLQRIEATGFRYRLLERGNARRARRGLAYGDQGIFLCRSVFHQLGGFPDVPLLEDLILMQGLRRLTRPVLLPGPIHVDARRWVRHGIVRQTVRNWALITAYRAGVAPERLARFYGRHDQ